MGGGGVWFVGYDEAVETSGLEEFVVHAIEEGVGPVIDSLLVYVLEVFDAEMNT